MAATHSVGAGFNPLSTGTGASFPSANAIIDVSTWKDPLEPRLNPITNRCKKGKPVDNMKHEWGQSYHTPIFGTIAEALDTTETGIDLTSGQGSYLQKWMKLEVIDWKAGSNSTILDYSTREEVIIDTDPTGSDTVTVKRNQGQGTGVSHSSGAYWGVVGIAMPYMRDFTLSPTTQGDKLFNHSQRFFGALSADIVAENTPNYEFPNGNVLDTYFKRELQRQKHFLERAIVMGDRYTGDQAAGDSAIPHQMGGINYFIVNHSGRVTNLAGAKLNPYDIDDIFRDQFKEIADGGAQTVLMDPDTTSVFDGFMPSRMATTKDTTINTAVKELAMRWGHVDIEPIQHFPQGTMMFVDFNDIYLCPRKGAAWSNVSFEPGAGTNGPYRKRAVWGEYTLRVEEVTRMGKLWNFNLNLNLYSRRSQF